jgi:hypothetical protein
MTPEETVVARGRKVFFVYPHSVLSEDLLVDILSSEYEIYCLKSHLLAEKAAQSWPHSIFFINIDEALSETQWDAWIGRLRNAPATAAARLGIVTYNPNPERARKYLMEMGLPCGFIQLKLGVTEAKKIILRTLEANEARGRRKFVRARCAEGSQATFNVSVREAHLQGSVLDISAAGMAFQFDSTFGLTQGTRLEDVQLRMKGLLCKVSGTYRGTVREEEGRNLLLFEPAPNPDTKAKIHRFIYLSLQEEMAELMRVTQG